MTIKVSDYLIPKSTTTARSLGSAVNPGTIATTSTGAVYIPPGAGGPTISTGAAGAIVGTGAGTSGMVGLYAAYGPVSNSIELWDVPVPYYTGGYYKTPTWANSFLVYYNLNNTVRWQRRGADFGAGYPQIAAWHYDYNTNRMCMIFCYSRSGGNEYFQDWKYVEVDCDTGTTEVNHPLVQDALQALGAPVHTTTGPDLLNAWNAKRWFVDGNDTEIHIYAESNLPAAGWGYQHIVVDRTTGAPSLWEAVALRDATNQNLPYQDFNYVSADRTLFAWIDMRSADAASGRHIQNGDLWVLLYYRHPATNDTHCMWTYVCRSTLDKMGIQFFGTYNWGINVCVHADNIVLFNMRSQYSQRVQGVRAFKRVDWDNWLKAIAGIVVP